MTKSAQVHLQQKPFAVPVPMPVSFTGENTGQVSQLWRSHSI